MKIPGAYETTWIIQEMIKTIYSSNLIQEIINGLFKHFHFDTINHLVLLAIGLYNSSQGLITLYMFCIKDIEQA